MDMKQCSMGHFYDASLYDSCPYCDKGSVERQAEPSVVGATVPLYPNAAWKPEEENYTVPLDAMDNEIRPVVGWMVCVDGPDKGRAFEIHSDNNYLGRSPEMDINIPNDRAISRDKPVVITYDNRSRGFYCGFMGGKSIVRLNNMPLISTTQLSKGDILELGSTKLMFVPLCDENFTWDENTGEE